MRKAATFRLDAQLLASARLRAREDNRSLTNLVETLLKSCVGERAAAPGKDNADEARHENTAAE